MTKQLFLQLESSSTNFLLRGNCTSCIIPPSIKSSNSDSLQETLEYFAANVVENDLTVICRTKIPLLVP